MTAALGEACGELTRWLPAAAVLIAQADTDGATPGSKPGSRPPWNAAAANAVLDACEATIRLATVLRVEVTGGPGVKLTYTRTGTAIRLIADLGVNASHATVTEAARQITAMVTVIRQLPAIDLDERFILVRGASCPYCEIPMLKLGTRSWRVTCLRHGVCVDGNGDHPRGFVTTTPAGEAFIAWADGYNQYAALAWEDDDDAYSVKWANAK